MTIYLSYLDITVHKEPISVMIDEPKLSLNFADDDDYLLFCYCFLFFFKPFHLCSFLS